MNELFETRPTSAKLRCKVCGHAGYPWPGWSEGAAPYPRWWANACLRGHAPCPRCGKELSVLRNGNPRTHGTCPRGRAA